MRRILLIWFFIPSLLLTQHIWFSDDFSKGLSGKNWNVSSGNWELKDGVLSIETKEYDQLICAPLLIYNVHDFTIEVELNGNRAGIFFSLDNRNNKNLSQMVRFDEQSLLTGFFNSNGEYNATNVFDVKKSPTDWSSLKIDVRPSERIFNISINGEFIGSDTLLKFVSGYIGLQASEGISLFKSVKVTSKFPYIRQPIPSLGTKLNTQHLDWIRSKGSQIELFTPLYNKIVTINKDNTVFDVQNCKIPVVKRKYIKNGKLQISIDGNGILLNDKFRKYSKKITEQLVRPAEILQGKENSFLVVDPGALAIFQFDFEGRLVKKYTAATIGGFKSCNSFDWYGKNEIVVADYDRIIFIPSSLDEIQTQIKQTSKNETTISWTSEIESVPEVIIKAKGEKEISIKGTRTKTLNSVKLFNLKSATKYSFTISPTIRVLPEKDCMSKTFHFVSGPTALNKTLISRLPVLIMVYRTISYRDIYTKLQYPNIPSGRTLSNDEIEDLKNCASFNSEFFFRNSHCKMVLDFDFFVIEDTLWLKEVGMKDPYWLGPNERVTKDYEKTCSIFNKSPESYAGLIVPYAWLNFPPRRRSAMSDASKTDTVNIRQAVGGGTYGVPAPWKYGKTTGYTSNPFQDRFSRQDWLITHEFHHQIDA
jgi:hypothetical protein